MNTKFGYACINMTLKNQKVSVNRGMIRKTFLVKGLPYVSQLIIKNIKDLITIVKWNEAHNIKFYRMSSSMFPWMSEYEIEELPNINVIKSLLFEFYTFVNANDHRITYHPGQFNNLASPKQKVVENTILDINKHAQIMDMIGFSQTPFNKINIHIGGTYKNKKDTLKRWCDNFFMLNTAAQKRLTIENDDKINCYKIEDLMYVHNRIGIPIVLDCHHHSCNNSMPLNDAMNIAVNTWKNIKPVIHISEPRKDNKRAHSDFIQNKIETFDHNVDVMFEAKQKELAILKYRNNGHF